MGANDLGILFAVVGFALLGSIWLALRSVSRNRSHRTRRASIHQITGLEAHDEAVLLVQPGGKVLYLNAQARRFFNLKKGQYPDLEFLAHQVRPADAFLSLCAAEGRTTFALHGKPVEGVSYSIPYGPESNVLLTLRPTQPAAEPAAALLERKPAGEPATLDLEIACRSVLDRLAGAFPADYIGMTVWNPGEQNYHAYCLMGAAAGRQLENFTISKAQEGHSSLLVNSNQSLLIQNPSEMNNLFPTSDWLGTDIVSFAGVPLLSGEEPIGTLELADTSPEAFTRNDIERLKFVSQQLAPLMSQFYTQQKSSYRLGVMSALTDMLAETSTLKDADAIIARLVQTLSTILNVNVLGFLHYDRERHILEGVTPFEGIPRQFLEVYRVEIPQGSPAEKLLAGSKKIVTPNAAEDAHCVDLGIDHLLQAASIRETAFMPIITEGEVLGYLQASNHPGGFREFTPLEVSVLSLAADQVAPLVASVILRRRSQRQERLARMLHRAAESAAATHDLESSLAAIVKEITQGTGAEVTALYLTDEETGSLNLHLQSAVGLAGKNLVYEISLPVNSPVFGLTAAARQKPVFSGQLGAEENAPASFYSQWFQKFGIQTLFAAPLLAQNRALGELIVGSRAPYAFAQAEQEAVSVAANQLAALIDHFTLARQTDETLRSQVEQLTLLASVNRQLNVTLEPQQILQAMLDVLRRVTQADCGTLLMFESDPPTREQPAIKYYAGDKPRPDRIAAWMSDEQKMAGAIIRYTGKSARPPHAGVTSEMIVPLSDGKTLIGLADMHASREAFSEASLQTAHTLASQAGMLLSNALRFQEQAQYGQQLTRRLDVYSRLLENITQAPRQPLESLLTSVAANVLDAGQFKAVIIAAMSPEKRALQPVASAGLRPELWQQYRNDPQPWSVVWQYFLPEYRLGNAYCVPLEKQPGKRAASQLPWTSASNEASPAGVLLLPLLDSTGSPLGLVLAGMSYEDAPQRQAAVEVAEMFTGLAALSIENALQTQRWQSQILDMDSRIETLQQAAQTAQVQLKPLLHKDVEQTLAIHQLSRQSLQIRHGLEISETVNLQQDVQSVLSTLCRELLMRMDWDVAVVAESSAEGQRLLHLEGQIAPGSNPALLFGQRNPLRQCIQENSLIMVNDLAESPEWQGTALLNSLEAGGFVCMPVPLDERMSMGVMVASRKPLESFGDEDRQVYSQLARQTVIILQNLKLLLETRRRLDEVNFLLEFSRQLGSLHAEDILRALVEVSMRVVGTAHAGMAALWDAEALKLRVETAASYADSAAMHKIVFAVGEGLAGKAYAAGRALRISEVDFPFDYALAADNLEYYRQGTGGLLPVSSLCVPIMMGTKCLGAVELNNFTASAAFTAEHEALVGSLSQQAALALENARLFQAVEQRAAHLQALNSVSGAIAASMQSEVLITSSLLERFKAVIPYDNGTMWLRRGDQLIVGAVDGFEDNEQRLGLTIATDDSILFTEMMSTRQAIAVPDIRNDPRFPRLIEQPNLSWLGIPLNAKGELLGVIALEKKEARFYTPEHIQLATTFASQAAVAIENARLYEESLRKAEELDQRSNRLALLNRLSTELSGTLDQQHILDFICLELLRALNADLVSAVLFRDNRPVMSFEAPQQEQGLPFVLPDAPVFDYLRESLGVFHSSQVNTEPSLAPLKKILSQRGTRSLLILPLAAGQELQGLLLVHMDRDYHFSAAEIELGHTISNQAAISMQNARLFAETVSLSEDLDQRVKERTGELMREQRYTQALLDITTRLSSSFELSAVLDDTLTSLNKTVGSETSAIILLPPNPENIYCRDKSKFRIFAPGQEPQWIVALRKNLGERVMFHREALLLDDITAHPRWNASAADTPYHSVVAVPLIIGEEGVGALLLFHRKKSFFKPEHLNMANAVSNHVAVAVHNSGLYALIRDQADRLGNLLHGQQAETSRSRAILEAVADGIVVTDSGSIITLFNASAGRMLGLDVGKVLGVSLDYFKSVLGVGSGWIKTIQEWAADPESYQPDELYVEQVVLESGRVISVHLAPVFLIDEFLGTVSILRDITREVEVDRLKSEFVANVSHELRTPLTAIKGYVEILLMGVAGAVNEQQTGFLSVVRGNIDRLEALVNELLDISRIEAGRVTLSLQALNIQEIVDDIVAEITRRSEDEGKPMSFAADETPALPLVHGDPQFLRQILRGLLSNAYRYTPENGHVRVHMQQMGSEIQVDVIDDGIGIKPDDQHRIFDRFYRGEDALVLATAGTGLGLSIARTLVEMHGGRIWLTSSGVRGEGSTFSFTIPVYYPERQE